jgi:hypothetical protein
LEKHVVKLTYLIKKRPDLTREAFLQYWHISYTNLIRGMSAPLGLKKYVIHMRLETPSNILVRLERQLSDTEFDGIIEMSWTSLQNYQQAAGTPPGMDAINAMIDAERRFVDFSKSVAFFTESNVILEQ